MTAQSGAIRHTDQWEWRLKKRNTKVWTLDGIQDLGCRIIEQGILAVSSLTHPPKFKTVLWD
jgi:hypothetical protein